MAEAQLPDQFQDLNAYFEWSLGSERERSAKRQASDIAALEEFYATMFPRMEEILQFLAQYPLDNIPADVQLLLNLTFMLAEIAPAVENFGQPSVIDGYDVARFKVVHN